MEVNSKDCELGSFDYYKARTFELEADRNRAQDATEYYKTELSKSHALLGRTMHQLSERWDSVHLTEYFPTDNLNNNRSLSNPTGNK